MLEVRDLTVEYLVDRHAVRAVDGVSFHVPPGGALGIVGESGCGKTTSALAILGLLPPSAAVHGTILFEGRDLFERGRAGLLRVRGRDISIIFQEPMSSLNPVCSIGTQIAEVVRVHERTTRAAARDRAVAMLAEVEMPRPREVASAYPHQLSGGGRQRVMIAMALACRPKLLIADEPTSSLDATTQADVLALFNRRRKESGMSLVLITHDFSVLAAVCDQGAVMQSSRILEIASVTELLRRPQHEYTKRLVDIAVGLRVFADVGTSL